MSAGSSAWPTTPGPPCRQTSHPLALSHFYQPQHIGLQLQAGCRCLIVNVAGRFVPGLGSMYVADGLEREVVEDSFRSTGDVSQ